MEVRMIQMTHILVLSQPEFVRERIERALFGERLRDLRRSLLR